MTRPGLAPGLKRSLPVSSPSSRGMFWSLSMKLAQIISVVRTSSENQTIPHLETVARVAYLRSWT